MPFALYNESNDLLPHTIVVSQSIRTEYVLLRGELGSIILRVSRRVLGNVAIAHPTVSATCGFFPGDYVEVAGYYPPSDVEEAERVWVIPISHAFPQKDAVEEAIKHVERWDAPLAGDVVLCLPFTRTRGRHLFLLAVEGKRAVSENSPVSIKGADVLFASAPLSPRLPYALRVRALTALMPPFVRELKEKLSWALLLGKSCCVPQHPDICAAITLIRASLPSFWFNIVFADQVRHAHVRLYITHPYVSKEGEEIWRGDVSIRIVPKRPLAWYARILAGYPFEAKPAWRAFLAPIPIVQLVKVLEVLASRRVKKVREARKVVSMMFHDPHVIHPEEVRWEDYVGFPDLKFLIFSFLFIPFRYPKYAQRIGIQVPTAVVMYGAPGTGKTYLAKVLASEASLTFLHFQPTHFFRKYVGESERFTQLAFQKARSFAPCLMFVDEVDSVVQKREELGGKEGAEVAARVTNIVLQNLSGLKASDEVCFIGATNRIQLLDDAFLSRTTLAIFFRPPVAHEAAAILRYHLRKIGADVRVQDWEQIGRELHNFPPREIVQVARTVGHVVLLEHPDKPFITDDDVLKVVRERRAQAIGGIGHYRDVAERMQLLVTDYSQEWEKRWQRILKLYRSGQLAEIAVAVGEGVEEVSS